LKRSFVVADFISASVGWLVGSAGGHKARPYRRQSPNVKSSL